MHTICNDVAINGKHEEELRAVMVIIVHICFDMSYSCVNRFYNRFCENLAIVLGSLSLRESNIKEDMPSK